MDQLIKDMLKVAQIITTEGKHIINDLVLLVNIFFMS